MQVALILLKVVFLTHKLASKLIMVAQTIAVEHMQIVYTFLLQARLGENGETPSLMVTTRKFQLGIQRIVQQINALLSLLEQNLQAVPSFALVSFWELTCISIRKPQLMLWENIYE